jgi:hypothetical protein
MEKYEYTIGKEVDLKEEQKRTLNTPRLKTNFILKGMILMLDLMYGRKRTLPKFMVLEILARYPYWAWETGGYNVLTKLHSSPCDISQAKVDYALHHMNMGRESQDNEQWHMLLLRDVIHKQGTKLGLIRHFLIPHALSFGYYFITKIMYALDPVWSFAMNAAFESHAEKEYMLMAEENPQWENEEVDSVHFKYYPHQKSLKDLLMRIALDERDHMHMSLEEVEKLKI